MTLQGQFQMSEQDAANVLFEVIEDIMNGKTLDVIIENIKDWDMLKMETRSLCRNVEYDQ